MGRELAKFLKESCFAPHLQEHHKGGESQLNLGSCPVQDLPDAVGSSSWSERSCCVGVKVLVCSCELVVSVEL